MVSPARIVYGAWNSPVIINQSPLPMRSVVMLNSLLPAPCLDWTPSMNHDLRLRLLNSFALAVSVSRCGLVLSFPHFGIVAITAFIVIFIFVAFAAFGLQIFTSIITGIIVFFCFCFGSTIGAFHVVVAVPRASLYCGLGFLQLFL